MLDDDEGKNDDGDAEPEDGALSIVPPPPGRNSDASSQTVRQPAPQPAPQAVHRPN